MKFDHLIKIIIICILFCLIAPLYAGTTPRLHVDGNKIKDPQGNIVVLRGVALIDLGATELWRGGAIEMIDRLTNPNDNQGSYTGWGTKVVRLAIYPTDGDFQGGPWYFQTNPDYYYNNLLRPVVDYCKSKDLYVIIDWHYVGVNTFDKVASTTAFWTYIAQKFNNDSHVLFELFNEPANTSVSGDAAKWESCRVNMQAWTDIIRSYAPDNLILVGCPQWSQIIAPTATNPVTGGNIVYVSHIYPDHWGGGTGTYVNQIRTAAAVHPVMITEWGFMLGGAVPTSGTLSGYGQPFHEFREELGIGHTAWCADYSWGPPMFNSDWTLRSGENYMGYFTKDILYEMKDANQPCIEDLVPPDAPTDLAATAGNSVVSLDWNDNSETDLTGYNVYRSTTSGTGHVKLNTSIVTDSNYTDNTAGGCLTYYYIVTALDTSFNESEDSNEVSATPTDTVPPSAPTGLTALVDNQTVSLNWNDNTEGDMDGYNVYRSTTSGSGYVKVNTSLLSSSDYIDTGLFNGTTYYYVVTAVDIVLNESDDSSEVFATPVPGIIYTFTGITAANTEYNAYACDVDVFPFAGDSGNRNSMVEATDAQYANISTDDTTEWASANPGMADEMFLWVEMKINEAPANIEKIDLTFDGYTTGSGDVTHIIYVLTAGADWTQNSSWTQVGSSQSISPGTYATMTRSITSGFGDYIDGTGKITWAVYETTSGQITHVNYLGMKVFAVDTAPPAAPEGLLATAGDETVSLDWNNNSESDMSGYNVYRSITSGSGYAKINPSLLSSSDYTDDAVVSGATYYYVVTAVDTSLNESDDSNEVSATLYSRFANCSEVQLGGYGLVSDFSGDCYVGYDDLETISYYWLHTDCDELDDCGGADFEPTNGIVDLFDFSDFALQWLQCNNPQDPDCTPNWDE